MDENLTPEQYFINWLQEQTPQTDAQAFEILVFYQAQGRLPEKGEELYPSYARTQLRFTTAQFKALDATVREMRRMGKLPDGPGNEP